MRMCKDVGRNLEVTFDIARRWSGRLLNGLMPMPGTMKKKINKQHKVILLQIHRNIGAEAETSVRRDFLGGFLYSI